MNSRRILRSSSNCSVLCPVKLEVQENYHRCQSGPRLEGICQQGCPPDNCVPTPKCHIGTFGSGVATQLLKLPSALRLNVLELSSALRLSVSTIHSILSLELYNISEEVLHSPDDHRLAIVSDHPGQRNLSHSQWLSQLHVAPSFAISQTVALSLPNSSHG